MKVTDPGAMICPLPCTIFKLAVRAGKGPVGGAPEAQADVPAVLGFRILRITLLPESAT